MSTITNIEISYFRHSYKKALGCAWGDIQARSGYYIQARNADGLHAIAELSPLEGFSKENLNQALESLEKVLVKIKGLSVPNNWPELNALLTTLKKRQNLLPSASWALEMLLLDLAAKSASMPVHAFLAKAYQVSDVSEPVASTPIYRSDPRSTSKVEVNALLRGYGEELLEQFLEKQRQGFKTFKVKYLPNEQDQLISSLRHISNTSKQPVTFRIDANQSLSLDECLRLFDQLQGLDIEYVEEPLRQTDISKLEIIKKNSAINIALDESLQNANAQKELTKAGVFEVAIIKPMLLGGYSSSCLLSQELKAAGVDTVVTSTLETPVGLLAGLHFAQLVQSTQRQVFGEKAKACGFDTLGLFAKNFLNNRLAARNGLIEIPAVDGLGFTSVEIADLIGTSES